MPEFSFSDDDLPDPQALGVILRHWMMADLARRPRKEAEEMLEEIVAGIALEARMSEVVVSIRPKEQHAEVQRERIRAAAWMERAAPYLLAKLRRK